MITLHETSQTVIALLNHTRRRTVVDINANNMQHMNQAPVHLSTIYTTLHFSQVTA